VIGNVALLILGFAALAVKAYVALIVAARSWGTSVANAQLEEKEESCPVLIVDKGHVIPLGVSGPRPPRAVAIDPRVRRQWRERSMQRLSDTSFARTLPFNVPSAPSI